MCEVRALARVGGREDSDFSSGKQSEAVAPALLQINTAMRI